MRVTVSPSCICAPPEGCVNQPRNVKFSREGVGSVQVPSIWISTDAASAVPPFASRAMV